MSGGTHIPLHYHYPNDYILSTYFLIWVLPHVPITPCHETYEERLHIIRVHDNHTQVGIHLTAGFLVTMQCHI